MLKLVQFLNNANSTFNPRESLNNDKLFLSINVWKKNAHIIQKLFCRSETVKENINIPLLARKKKFINLTTFSFHDKN